MMEHPATKTILSLAALAAAFWLGRQSVEASGGGPAPSPGAAVLEASNREADPRAGSDAKASLQPSLQPYLPNDGERRPLGRSGPTNEEASDAAARERIEAEVVARLVAELGLERSAADETTTGEGPLVGGVRHGTWVLHYPKSALRDEGRYLLGVRHGPWTVTNAAGDVIRQRTFVNGLLHGTMRDRLHTEEAWRIYEYRFGELVD